MQSFAGFTRITQSQIINEGKTEFHGYDLEPSSANPRVSFYEGLDENSGRLIHTTTDYDVYATGSKSSEPIFCDRGLYVKITSGITAVTVYWHPVIRE